MSNSEEKTVFGCTLEEIKRMSDEIDSFTDSNTPPCQTPNGEDSFVYALTEGSKLLLQNTSMTNLFKVNSDGKKIGQKAINGFKNTGK